MNVTEKKRLWIFIAAAYGVTAVMNLLMIIGLKKQYDLTVFVNTQMMYPACGVILGKIICNKDEKLPVGGYITVLVTTAVMMIMSILSLIIHIEPMDIGGGTTVDVWNLASSIPIMVGGITAYILFWTCGKDASENAGLRRKNIGLSVIMVAAFIVLFIVRMFVICVINNELSSFGEALTDPNVWKTALILPFNFFFTFIAFFGEEYGWRYYLQPLMQKKMGRRAGVLVLGLVWALWHIGVDFMYYTTECGPQAFVTQIITCVIYAVFFGYAYMKTDNIWVPVIMHYLNNNLAVLFAGGNGDVLQNQVIPWSSIPMSAAGGIVFFLFILAPVYGRKAAEDD